MSEEQGMETMNDLRVYAAELFEKAEEVPPKAQMCIAMRAFGWGPKKTAKLTGISVDTVKWYLKRHDPGNLSGRGDVIRKLVLKNACGLLLLETLGSFKPGELKELSPMDRLKAGKMLAELSEKFSTKQLPLGGGARRIRDGLKMAEVEVKKGKKKDTILEGDFDENEAEEADGSGEKPQSPEGSEMAQTDGEG